VIRPFCPRLSPLWSAFAMSSRRPNEITSLDAAMTLLFQKGGRPSLLTSRASLVASITKSRELVEGQPRHSLPAGHPISLSIS
jgi:hypothetical protein